MRPPLHPNSVVLITGASAGIGRELAREFAPRVGTLILVARREDRLNALREELMTRHPHLKVFAEARDLCDLSAIDAMLKSAEAAGPVDILVNNAGLGDSVPFDQSDWRKVERMVQLNVTALVYLTHRLLPGMIERGRGGILNVSSGAGYALMAGQPVYVGTKHFVSGFTETLRLELAGTGVVVTEVAPGPVDTEFIEAAGYDPEDDGGPPRYIRISAKRCARIALRGFERGVPVVFPGYRYRLLMRLYGLTPRWLVRLILGEIARRQRRSRFSGKDQG